MSANSTMTGIHVELIVLAAEAIVMSCGIVDINHRLSSLSQFQPVAEAEAPAVISV